MKKTAFALIATTLILVVARLSTQHETLQAVEDAGGATLDELPPLKKPSSRGFGNLMSFPMYQSATRTRIAAWGHGSGKELTLEHVNRTTGALRSFSYGASFRIDALVAQEYRPAKNTETYYALGTTDLGDQVIERWIHKPKKVQILGQPLVYVLKRKLIFSGSSLAEIEHIQVEPTGDFLVVAHNDGNYRHVSQIQLPGGTPVTQVIDGSQTSTGMEDGVISVSRALHDTEGLLWMICLFGEDPSLLVLRDLNADGLLDDWMGYDYDTQLQLYPPYFYDAPWVDDFIKN